MHSIICISDSHLGYRHRSKTQRLKDFRAAFEGALDKALTFGPGVIVFGGDLLHQPKPDPVSMRAVVQGLLRVADKTQVVVVIGNHEIAGHLGTTYAPIYSDLHKNIHVLSTETPHIQLDVYGKKIGFHGFQFIRNREIAEKTLTEVSSEAGKSDFDVLCLHQAVEGYLSPHEISLSALREVASKFNLILSGHVHKHQKIIEVFDVCPAYYIGSTERISFNEWENKTGFMVFEDYNFASPNFLEVESASMKKITCELGPKTPQEINAFVESKIREQEGTKLLQIEVKAEVLGDILDVRQDLSDVYPSYTLLDVNIVSPLSEKKITLERLEISQDTIREYFEKSGLVNQEELLSTCVKLFEEYGR